MSGSSKKGLTTSSSKNSSIFELYIRLRLREGKHANMYRIDDIDTLLYKKPDIKTSHQLISYFKHFRLNGTSKKEDDEWDKIGFVQKVYTSDYYKNFFGLLEKYPLMFVLMDYLYNNDVLRKSERIKEDLYDKKKKDRLFSDTDTIRDEKEKRKSIFYDIINKIRTALRKDDELHNKVIYNELELLLEDDDTIEYYVKLLQTPVYNIENIINKMNEDDNGIMIIEKPKEKRLIDIYHTILINKEYEKTKNHLLLIIKPGIDNKRDIIQLIKELPYTIDYNVDNTDVLKLLLIFEYQLSRDYILHFHKVHQLHYIHNNDNDIIKDEKLRKVLLYDITVFQKLPLPYQHIILMKTNDCMKNMNDEQRKVYIYGLVNNTLSIYIYTSLYSYILNKINKENSKSNNQRYSPINKHNKIGITLNHYNNHILPLLKVINREIMVPYLNKIYNDVIQSLYIIEDYHKPFIYKEKNDIPDYSKELRIVEDIFINKNERMKCNESIYNDIKQYLLLYNRYCLLEYNGIIKDTIDIFINGKFKDDNKKNHTINTIDKYLLDYQYNDNKHDEEIIAKDRNILGFYNDIQLIDAMKRLGIISKTLNASLIENINDDESISNKRIVSYETIYHLTLYDFMKRYNNDNHLSNSKMNRILEFFSICNEQFIKNNRQYYLTLRELHKEKEESYDRKEYESNVITRNIHIDTLNNLSIGDLRTKLQSMKGKVLLYNNNNSNDNKQPLHHITVLDSFTIILKRLRTPLENKVVDYLDLTNNRQYDYLINHNDKGLYILLHYHKYIIQSLYTIEKGYPINIYGLRDEPEKKILELIIEKRIIKSNGMIDKIERCTKEMLIFPISDFNLNLSLHRRTFLNYFNIEDQVSQFTFSYIGYDKNQLRVTIIIDKLLNNEDDSDDQSNIRYLINTLNEYIKRRDVGV